MGQHFCPNWEGYLERGRWFTSELDDLILDLDWQVILFLVLGRGWGGGEWFNFFKSPLNFSLGFLSDMKQYGPSFVFHMDESHPEYGQQPVYLYYNVSSCVSVFVIYLHACRSLFFQKYRTFFQIISKKLSLFQNFNF